MRFLKQWLAPAAMIALGLSVLSATASSTLVNETVNYSYDELGRLVKVEQRSGASSNTLSNYTYDKAGNRTNVKVTGAP